MSFFFFYAEQYKQEKERKNNKKKDKQKASAITPFQTRRYETTLKKKMAARMNWDEIQTSQIIFTSSSRTKWWGFTDQASIQGR